jgi:hypothetical protein
MSHDPIGPPRLIEKAALPAPAAPADHAEMRRLCERKIRDGFAPGWVNAANPAAILSLLDQLAKVTAERDQAIADADKLEIEVERRRNLAIERSDRADALAADLAVMREALTKYGQHIDGCAGISAPCNCGLNAALAAKP